MTIIVLQGPPNSGKTSVIRLLIEKLTTDGYGQFVCKNDEERFRRSNDCSVPIVYKGVLIALSTYGDTVADLLAPFEKFVGYANVFVCAAHPDGSTAALVEEWGEQHTVTTVPKDKVSEHEQAHSDKKVANEMYEIIKKSIKAPISNTPVGG